MAQEKTSASVITSATQVLDIVRQWQQIQDWQRLTNQQKHALFLAKNYFIENHFHFNKDEVSYILNNFPKEHITIRITGKMAEMLLKRYLSNESSTFIPLDFNGLKDKEKNAALSKYIELLNKNKEEVVLKYYLERFDTQTLRVFESLGEKQSPEFARQVLATHPEKFFSIQSLPQSELLEWIDANGELITKIFHPKNFSNLVNKPPSAKILNKIFDRLATDLIQEVKLDQINKFLNSSLYDDHFVAKSMLYKKLKEKNPAWLDKLMSTRVQDRYGNKLNLAQKFFLDHHDYCHQYHGTHDSFRMKETSWQKNICATIAQDYPQLIYAQCEYTEKYYTREVEFTDYVLSQRPEVMQYLNPQNLPTEEKKKVCAGIIYSLKDKKLQTNDIIETKALDQLANIEYSIFAPIYERARGHLSHPINKQLGVLLEKKKLEAQIDTSNSKSISASLKI